MFSRDIRTGHSTDDRIGVGCDCICPLIGVFFVSPAVSLGFNINFGRSLKSHDITGSGSSRLSERNRWVARALQRQGLATLLFDLLTPAEAQDRRKVFDIVLTMTGNGTMTDLDITDTASPFRNINLPDFILYQYRIADVDGDGNVDFQALGFSGSTVGIQ